MQVDLETQGAEVAAMPRFQRAAFHTGRLQRWGAGLLGLAVLGLVSAVFVDLFAALTIWPALLVNLSCALLVVVAGLQSACWVSRWREEAINLSAALAPEAVDKPVAEGFTAALGVRWRLLLQQIGAPTLWLAGWSLLILYSQAQVFNLSLPASALGLSASVAAVLALLLAFALLVLERQLAQESSAQWPEAAALAQLVRVAIGCLLVSALCLLFSREAALWPVRLAVLIGLLPALVAGEWLLRALLSLFSPQHDRREPRLLAHSFIAHLLRWPPQPLLSVQHELHNRFGIDLRQIWAFAYMRRACLPIVAVVLLLGWLLTGVHELSLQNRGIYERFGKPVKVFAPGLHVGLPWPLGRVISVENGVVHELATSVGDNSQPLPPASAEGPAPAIANRLWDASHINDKSQVIASGNARQQSFQIVNMDVRFIYRIGLDDASALAATYHSDDVPTLIRRTASRVLVHDFASRTLDGLLGEDRTGLADDIGRAVQADLARLDSGVEILATVVEAIHPPAGAANAYHGVQAAQIGAQALIARERGAAAEQTNQAQLQASVISDKARADAREVQATAEAADRRFAAEQQAYARAGQAFVLEQYLSQLSQGLRQAKLLILDHRLGGDTAPTLDLRTFTLPADPVPPRKAAQPGAVH
ncbi:protease modulator HflK [Pseudomonas sp. LD120]|uniref:protease modulator HflK n=1 Tax=Pseudomonas sp. LD120 TaxID=485751 RepID=UPI00135B4588|nr:protease modulator HflK [Pseudomonas sp. LD120]KAF0862030.1 protease modulator HflK [Pseudomonas sp. LD120]